MFRSKHFASRHFKAVWPSVTGWLPVSLTVGSPEIGQPALHQKHALLPNMLTLGSPTFGLPILSTGAAYTLQANALVVGSPDIAQADFHQRHSLLPTWLTVASPSIGISSLRQHHLLMANLLAIASPYIGSPQFRSPALPVYIYEKIYLEGRADSISNIEGRGGKE
jgi:hypothetical protein